MCHSMAADHLRHLCGALKSAKADKRFQRYRVPLEIWRMRGYMLVPGQTGSLLAMRIIMAFTAAVKFGIVNTVSRANTFSAREVNLSS